MARAIDPISSQPHDREVRYRIRGRADFVFLRRPSVVYSSYLEDYGVRVVVTLVARLASPL